ncbi:MAG: PIN domain-containing protein [Betaproteobacteria bacterium]|nr:PIN domain-containing protein [Betaproteobacteria bacterium]
MRSVLVDAGPLIALADRSDKHHRRVAAFLRRFEGRLLTTWPVLAEACHFLPARTQVDFLRWADAGGVSVFELHESAFAALADWKEKYLDLPMDPADATLLWVAQQTGVLEILTIDLKDFSVYRLPGGKALRPVL